MSQKILHHLTMLGESAEYRAARNKLLTEEMALRRQIESVAALRRALPAGGQVAQDYLFNSDDGALKLSDLFKPGRARSPSTASCMGQKRNCLARVVPTF